MIYVKYRNSVTEPYKYKQLGLNSRQSQADYADIMRNNTDVIVKQK